MENKVINDLRKDYKLCNLFCIFKDIFYILTIEEWLCEKESYKDYVKTFIPQKMETKVFRAFIVGGLIGVFAEFLIQFYSKVLNISAKAASTPMIVTLIAIASF